MATIFTKIIEGEIPSYKLYENDLVYVFLDINPAQPGHALVVPKCEVDQFVDVNDPYYQEVFRIAKAVAKAQKSILNKQRVCLKVEGFAVPHFHCHLIPADNEDEFNSKGVTLICDQMQQLQADLTKAIAEELTQ